MPSCAKVIQLSCLLGYQPYKHSSCTPQCLQAGASHARIPVQVQKAGGPGDSTGTVPAETEVVHMDQNDSWFRDTGPAVRPPSGRHSAAQHSCTASTKCPPHAKSLCVIKSFTQWCLCGEPDSAGRCADSARLPAVPCEGQHTRGWWTRAGGRGLGVQCLGRRNRRPVQELGFG